MIQFMNTLLNKKNLYIKSNIELWNHIRFQIVVMQSNLSKSFSNFFDDKQLNKRVVNLASKLVNQSIYTEEDSDDSDIEIHI